MTTKRAFSEDVYSEVEDIKSGKGKRHHQKIKPYAVLQYLLKYADEDHVASANKIVSYLQEHGINAERRSVCDDIQEINRIAIMVEEDCSIKEAAAILKWFITMPRNHAHERLSKRDSSSVSPF